MVPSEKAMVFRRLTNVTIALYLYPFGAICHRMFPTLKSTGVGHFGAKFGVEGIDRWGGRDRPM